LSEQRADAVDWLVGTALLPPSGRVAEFPGSHGGTWLDLLGAYGLRAARTDELADVVLDASFGLMHAPDQLAAGVFGYGAASGAVALLNLAGLDERLLLGVADAAAAKHGCRVPGTSA
jgi:hypothetical protein